MPQLTPEMIIEGAKGPSEQIRRLAKHGYTRAEIAKLLGKRYQHVRKVLMDSGFTGGLSTRQRPKRTVEFEVEAVESIETDAAPSEVINPDRLEKGGFYRGGDWVLKGNGLEFEGRIPKGFGVYAVISLNDILYVGVTTDLSRRMSDYKYGNKGQSTSRRINGLIKSTLEEGIPVHMFFNQPGQTEIKGLPVDISTGLEIALIKAIQPEWNLKHVRAGQSE